MWKKLENSWMYRLINIFMSDRFDRMDESKICGRNQMNRGLIRGIGGTDGPTSYFILSRDKKLTIKQKIQKFRFNMRKVWIEKHISAKGHTIEEVCQYIQDKYGFQEVEKSSAGFRHEYEEMRASFLITHSPELLGEYAARPKLKSHEEKDIKKFMEEIELQKNKAISIPKEVFDIDFHKYVKKDGDIEMHIIIEKKFEHIGGGVSGSKKAIREFNKIFKDIYRYYGVTQEDIEHKTKRYDNLVRRLAQR